MNIKQKKSVISLFLVVVTVMLLCFAFVSPTNVAADAYGHDPNQISFGMGRTVYDMATFIFGNQILNQAKPILTFDISAGGKYDPLWQSIIMVYNVIGLIGIGVLLVYFLLELLEKVQNDNFNVEHFIKLLIKLFAGILLVNNGLTILEGGIAFTNTIFDDIVASFQNGGTSAAAQAQIDHYFNQVKDLGGGWSALTSAFTCIGLILELAVPYIAMYVCYVFVLMASYGRAVEIGVRAVFAPIGMANIFDGGINSSGFRYLKKFLAVGLQGATIGVILIGYSSLSNIIIGEGGWSVLVQQVILAFTVVGLISKSSSWANDILGV